jgi:hypothetical protein
MTVSAIAIAGSITIQTNEYIVSPHWFVTDGINTYEGDASAEIPFTWGSRHANRFIRERIAASILSSHSLTIDPEDIYIPLS